MLKLQAGIIIRIYNIGISQLEHERVFDILELMLTIKTPKNSMFTFIKFL